MRTVRLLQGRAAARELRPVRWSRPRGWRSALRAALVTALLVLSAGILYSGPPDDGCATAAGGTTVRGTARDTTTSGRTPVGAAPACVPGTTTSGGTAGVAAPTAAGPAGTGGTTSRPRNDPADGTTSGDDRAGDGAAAGPKGEPPRVPDGMVGVAVRVTEPAILTTLRPGDRVDLLAVVPAGSAPESARVTPTASPVRLLASGALVLAVLGVPDGDEPAGLYLALRPDLAERTVSLPPESRFAVLVKP